MARRILLPLLLFVSFALLAPPLRAQSDTTDIPSQIDTASAAAITTGTATPLGDTLTTGSADTAAGDSLITRSADTIAVDSLPLFQKPARSTPAQPPYPMATATPARSSRLGFYAAADYSTQNAEIYFAGQSGRPSGGICICSFTEGEGFGYVGGLSLSLGFNNDRWWQTTRLSFASRNASSSFTETAIVNRPGVPLDTETTTETFHLDFQTLSGEILFSRSLGAAGFFATGGISIGYMLGNYYEVTLEVEEAEYKPRQGKLEPVEKLTTSLVAGVGIRLKLGESRVLMQPEVLYTYPLEEISRKYRWGYKSIRAGVTMLVTL